MFVCVCVFLLFVAMKIYHKIERTRRSLNIFSICSNDNKCTKPKKKKSPEAKIYKELNT